LPPGMIVNLLIYFTDLKFAWNTMIYLLEKQVISYPASEEGMYYDNVITY
jgi:hypothetical protein